MTKMIEKLTQLIEADDDLAALKTRLISDDAEMRRIALIDVADFGDENHLPILIAALNDTAALVRTEAARLLAGWENDGVVDGLANALLDTDANVRSASAQSLSELKTAQAGTRLLPWAEHENIFVKTAVLRALRELRLPAAAIPARAALSHTDAGLRREAVGVVGWLKYREALPQLAQLAIEDSEAEVRRAATGALGMTESDAELPALLTALRDAVWTVREEAATTLGKLLPAAAGPALIAALSDSAWQVQLRAARALGRLRNSAALTALIELLQHALSNVRKEAALALGEIGDHAAINALTVAAKDSDPDVRKAARLALSQLAEHNDLSANSL